MGLGPDVAWQDIFTEQQQQQLEKWKHCSFVSTLSVCQCWIGGLHKSQTYWCSINLRTTGGGPR